MKITIYGWSIRAAVTDGSKTVKQSTRSTAEVDQKTVAPSLDRTLVAQLVAQAKADGVSLTREGGLLG
ncbi:hypothetical protein ACWG5P_23990 [Streptomyces prasinus]